MTSSFFDFFPTNLVKPVLSALLIILQALLLNHLVIKHKLSRALSTIPAAIFVLFSCFVLEPIIFHPALFANLFALLSLASLFKIYKKHLPVATIFNSGFYMTIASLIYPPYLIFLILLILGLFSLRNLSIKESLQLLIGCLAPIYFASVYFYFSGNFSLLTDHFYSNLSLPWKDIDFNLLLFTKVALTLITIIALVLYSNSAMKKKKYDAIKKIELSYWMLFLSLGSLFFTQVLSNSHLLLSSIPIAILGGLYMESKSNSITKEFLFILCIGVFIAFQVGII